jgi:tRNA(Ile)-lysidine synthase
MASSRKKKSSEVLKRIAHVLSTHVPGGAHLTLGLSGGIDSIVLLDILAQVAPAHPFFLSCIHIHHGLSPNADAWMRFARSAARRYGLRCAVAKVDIKAHRELGVEGAARTARYAAYAACETDFIVLAQHRDDQAETLLLQLLRGAGVAGLAAMPVRRPLENSRSALLRPMLDISRAQIEIYAHEHDLQWVEDESNADIGLARNFLRHRIVPQLQKLNPAANENIARSAAHLGEAQSLLNLLAEQDAALALAADSLDLILLSEWPAARAANLLRAWIAGHGLIAPSTLELQQILRQLLRAKRDAQISIRIGDYQLRRFQQRAYLFQMPSAMPADDFQKAWRGQLNWALPELGGRFCFERCEGEGIAARYLENPAGLSVRLRRGGEKIRPDAGRPRRELKKLLQEQGVAPWQRERLPLLFCGETLAFAPGIGIESALRAQPGEAGLRVRWEAHPEPRSLNRGRQEMRAKITS